MLNENKSLKKNNCMKKNRSKKNELETKWAEISAKAWTDGAFKKRLLADPESVLKEYGIDVKEMKFKIVENTEGVINLILPQKPSGDLTPEQLKEIAAAGSHVIMWKC